MGEEKIKFRNLSLPLKISIFGAWVGLAWFILMMLGFFLGFYAAMVI
jgi:hypothetical protein